MAIDIEKLADFWTIEAEESLLVAEHLVEKEISLMLCFLVIWPWKKY